MVLLTIALAATLRAQQAVLSQQPLGCLKVIGPSCGGDVPRLEAGLCTAPQQAVDGPVLLVIGVGVDVPADGGVVEGEDSRGGGTFRALGRRAAAGCRVDGCFRAQERAVRQD